MKTHRPRIRIQLLNKVWRGDADQTYPEMYKVWINKQYPKFPQATHVRLGTDSTMTIEEALNGK